MLWVVGSGYREGGGGGGVGAEQLIERLSKSQYGHIAGAAFTIKEKSPPWNNEVLVNIFVKTE